MAEGGSLSQAVLPLNESDEDEEPSSTLAPALHVDDSQSPWQSALLGPCGTVCSTNPFLVAGGVATWFTIVTLCLMSGVVHGVEYSIADAMYLTAQTLTTVGYGDMPLSISSHGYIFASFMVLSAVIVVAHFISSVTGFLVDAEAKAVNTALAGFRRADSCNEQVSAVKCQRLFSLVASVLTWLFFMITWALFFVYYPGEEKNMWQAIYMAVVTMTTVGYGDVIAVTQGGRIFASIWMILGTTAFSIMVAKFVMFSAFFCKRATLERVDEHSLKRLVDFKRTESMRSEKAHYAYIRQLMETWEEGGAHKVADHLQSKISRNDFIVFMLLDMQLVDEDVINELAAYFNHLDVTGEGLIDDQDMMDHTASARNTVKRASVKRASLRELGSLPSSWLNS